MTTTYLPQQALLPEDLEQGNIHWRAPMVDAFRNYEDKGTVPFSTPGHKRGGYVDHDLRDIVGDQMLAADVWLNSRDHDLALMQAETLAAATWQADRAFFLVNGSSSGNHAMLLGTLNPGDEVIVARDMHKSLLNALILTGACPIYVTPRLHPDLHVSCGVEAADIAQALVDHPNARMVILTSPTYHGVSSDVRAIAKVAHSRDVPVYVDSAWGAHLGFHPFYPESAMQSGADACVVSCHKTLGALSQASILLVNEDRFDLGRIGTTVRMTQSTSRCLPLLLSLDTTRRQMAIEGRSMMESTAFMARWARRSLLTLPGLRVIDHDQLGINSTFFDPTRLVIDVGGWGLTGYEAEQILRDDYAVAPEMSDAVGVVCLITQGDSTRTVEQLVSAFTALSRRSGLNRVRSAPNHQRSVGNAVAAGVNVMSPREAFYAPYETLPIHRASGRIAAELIVPYPPGIPVLAPGERISVQKADYLIAACGRYLAFAGSADPTCQTIRVVVE